MSPSSKRRRPAPSPARPSAPGPSPARADGQANDDPPVPADDVAAAGAAARPSRLGRLAPGAGVAYALLAFIGFSRLPVGKVDPEDSAQAIAAQLVADRGRVSTGILVTLLSLFFLLVFVAWLHRWLRRVEGPAGWVAMLPLAGGVLMAATLSVLVLVSVAGTVIEDYGPDPVIARTLLVLQWHAWVIAFIPTAAFVGGTSAVGLTADVLPRWLTYSGLAIALGLLFPPIAFLPFLFSTLWTGMLAVTLLQRSRSGLL